MSTPPGGNGTGGPRHLLVRANSLRLPVASGSVHSCICSPPYLGLRDYGLDPTPWPEISFAPMVDVPPVTVPPMVCCLGLEPSIRAYVGHLVLIAREVWRCLHVTGSFWINLGDSYTAGQGSRNGTSGSGLKRNVRDEESRLRCCEENKVYRSAEKQTVQTGVPPLNLLMVPARVALALQADGWILRAAPPWIKPGSAMPESCRSRPNVSTEMIFMLTKSDRYYFDMEQVRRGTAPATLERDKYSRVAKEGSKGHIAADGREADMIAGRAHRLGADHRGPYGVQHDHETVSHPDGRHWRTSDLFLDSLDSAIAFHADRLAELEAARARGGLLGAEGGEGPGAFLVNPQSYAGSHYAAWPTKLVQDMVKCSTSEHGVCSLCGSPWERVMERKPSTSGHKNWDGATSQITKGLSRPGMWYDMQSHTLGWLPTCFCPFDTPRARSVVLDPFGGSGCTAATAVALGRNAISVDLSADYQSLARARVERPHRPISRRPRPGRPATLPGFADDPEDDE